MVIQLSASQEALADLESPTTASKEMAAKQAKLATQSFSELQPPSTAVEKRPEGSPVVPPIIMPKFVEASATTATPGSPRDDEDEELEEEEVDVIEMHELDFNQLQQEFDLLEKVIEEIKSIPPPPAPQKKTPREVIPELTELDKCIDTLESVIIKTTPQRAINKDQTVRITAIN